MAAVEKNYRKQITVKVDVDAADASANTKDVVLYDNATVNDIVVLNLFAVRAGAVIPFDGSFSYDKATGTLTINDGTAYVLTDGDVINICFIFDRA